MKPPPGAAAAKLRLALSTHLHEIALVLAVVTYTTIFSYATYMKHYTFSSFAWDLGIFNQIMRDTVFEGKLF